jgi:hypothetical protein
MMPIMSKRTHQAQDPSAFPVVPLTPQCSRHLLTELPAPPAHRACEFIGVDKSNESSNIYLPMLAPTLSPSSAWDEFPGLKPRLSTLMLDANSECSVLSTPVAFSNYLFFPSEDMSSPSPAALDGESLSLGDDSIDELFLDFPMASELHSEGLSRKDPSWWLCPCPCPSTTNGDSPGVRLQPRSLSPRSKDEVRDNSFIHIMPMEL